MLVEDPLHPDELRVKVLDFGIAKLARRSTPSADERTQVGSFMGTFLTITTLRNRSEGNGNTQTDSGATFDSI